MTRRRTKLLSVLLSAMMLTTVVPSAAFAEEAAPVQQTEAVPVQQTEAAPVQQTEAAPVQQTEAAPVQQTEAAPVQQTEAAPVQQTEAAPVQQTEAAPVQETEAAPVQQTEAAPVQETEAAPVQETEAAPAQETEAAQVQETEAAPAQETEAAQVQETEAAPAQETEAVPDGDAETDTEEASSEEATEESTEESEDAEEESEEAVFQVTFDLCGHGDVIEAVSVPENGLITKPADPAAEGYSFDGWYTNDAYETAWDFDNEVVVGDMILYAKWSEADAQTDPEAESLQGAALQEIVKTEESGAEANVKEETAASGELEQSGTKKSVDEASDWEYPGFDELNDQFDCNWMSHLPDGAKLNELSIPGAHDAAATYTGDDAVGTFLEYFTVTQDNYIDGLLENGIRYFDLRINKDGDDLAMCHQFVDLYGRDTERLKLDSVIYDMQRFLRSFGQKETLILQIKCDHDNCDYEIYQYFQKLMEENPDLIYCGDHVPTLGEVRGKLVILSRLQLIGSVEGEHETVAEWTRRRMTPYKLDDGTYWALDVSAFNGGDGATKSMTKTSEFGSTIVWTEDMYDVKKWDKNVWVNYSLLEHGNPPENHYADRNKKEAREEGKDAWSIIYSSMSHQDEWGIVEDVLIPWTSVEKLLTEDMVWPREGANYMNPVLKELIASIPDLYTGCLVGDFYDTDLIRQIYTTNYMRRNKDPWNSYYDVQFDSQGGSAVVTQSVLYGNKAVRPADPVWEGYRFDGWYSGGTAYDFSSPVYKNTLLQAQWSHAHALTRVDAKEATCTEDGNIEYWICNQGPEPCGRYFLDADGATEIEEADTIIKATGHKPGAAVRENEEAATCTEDGSYDEVVYCSACKEELSREAKVIPALGHDWSEWEVTKEATREAEGEETRTCKHDPSHKETRAIPKLEPEETEESETITYRTIQGDGQKWTKGSGAAAVFAFERSVNGEETFSHFTGIQVDGREVAASDYTARSGSVIISLQPAYLETLSLGEHTLTASFDDGNSPSAGFTVVPASNTDKQPAKDAGKPAAATAKPAAPAAPATGDESDILLWMTLMAASLAAMAAAMAADRKRKTER